MCLWRVHKRSAMLKPHTTKMIKKYVFIYLANLKLSHTKGEEKGLNASWHYLPANIVRQKCVLFVCILLHEWNVFYFFSSSYFTFMSFLVASFSVSLRVPTLSTEMQIFALHVGKVWWWWSPGRIWISFTATLGC